MPSSPLLARRPRPEWDDPDDEDLNYGTMNHFEGDHVGQQLTEKEVPHAEAENAGQNGLFVRPVNFVVLPNVHDHYAHDVWEEDSEDWSATPENDLASENSMQFGLEIQDGEDLKGSKSRGENSQDGGVMGEDGAYVPSVFNFDPDSFGCVPAVQNIG